MKSERGALILSVVMSLVVGAAAVAAASLTQPKAILLDGLFNLIYFLVALVTVRQCQVRMVRPGRQLYVMIHVVLPADFPLTGLPQLDTLRERLTSAVSAVYPHQVTDTLFTADAKWAEPCDALPVVSTPRR